MAFGDMNYDDRYEYLKNKQLYEGGVNQEQASAANEALRQKYNIAGDDYTADQFSRNVMPYLSNQYTAAADKAYAGLAGYTRYSDPYNTADLRRELENFSYNPDNDPAFKAYQDMYGRQSQAAQGQTLANLTSLSGGRNNSWASAAAAQVGQAYAQKTSDMVPRLAQQAYDRLLQRYGIEAQESDRAYGRYMDKYGMARDLAQTYDTRAEREMLNQRQRAMDDMAYRSGDLQQRAGEYNFAMEQKYGVTERELNIAMAEMNVEEKRIFMSVYQALVDGQLEQLQLTNEQQRILNKYLPQLQQGQINVQNAQAANFNKPRGGGGAEKAPKPMTKTEIKDIIAFEYNTGYGVDKNKVLEDLFNTEKFGDANTLDVLVAAGITREESEQWLKDDAEYRRWSK